MRELLNVLYIQTQGSVLHMEHDTVRVALEGETKLRAPLLRLGGIVVFGQVTLTPFLVQRCAEDGRSLVWLDRTGRCKSACRRAVAQQRPPAPRPASSAFGQRTLLAGCRHRLTAWHRGRPGRIAGRHEGR